MKLAPSALFNPYLSFDGGSLMSIPYANINLDMGKNIVTDLDVNTFLPRFGGPFADEQRTGIGWGSLFWSNRTRKASDDVYLFNVQTGRTRAPSQGRLLWV